MGEGGLIVSDIDHPNDDIQEKLTRPRRISQPGSPYKVRGIDFDCSDADPEAPVIKELRTDEPAVLKEWFTYFPETPCPALRLLVLEHRVPPPRPHNSAHGRAPAWQPNFPFDREILEHALWQHSAYIDILHTRAGGCAALLDEPVCFILQTPLDSGPFCSLALSKRGVIVQGTYMFRQSTEREERFFDPLEIMQGEAMISGWRTSGMQIISLPTAVARSQARYITSELEDIAKELDCVEQTLGASQAGDAGVDSLSPITGILQKQSSRLICLERRTNFQSQILTSIEVVTAAHRHGSKPWPRLAHLKNNLETWSPDLATLPRRIETAHRTIQSLLQQRNEALNLAMAKSSHLMMQAALRDNATMKTIAVMTMVFLPSTAVASFFSMQMFNWSADDSGDVVSRWLWVFFVVALPLTGIVVGLWWVWVKRSESRIERLGSGRDSSDATNRDLTGADEAVQNNGSRFTDEVELDAFVVDTKAGASNR